MPAATLPTSVATGTRVPAMTGRPPRIEGSTEILGAMSIMAASRRLAGGSRATNPSHIVTLPSRPHAYAPPSSSAPRNRFAARQDARYLPAMQAGEVIAERFEIEQRVGSGGMGEVYQARDRA